MAILDPYTNPTVGSPYAAVLPRRQRNLTQADFYKQQQDAGSPVDQSLRPQNPQFQQGSGINSEYITNQLYRLGNRPTSPELTPGSRVQDPNTSLVQPDNFKSYYDSLGSITDAGNQRTAAETARAAYRRQQELQAIANQKAAAPIDPVLDTGGGGAPGGGGNYNAPRAVSDWSDTTLQAMHMLGIPDNYLGAVLRRMNQESGGNPTIQNNWDSNAAAGHPSIGLMQTIGPTFNSYAGSLKGRGITDPLANIYAGLNYAGNTYGPAHGGFLGGVLYAMNKSGGY